MNGLTLIISIFLSSVCLAQDSSAVVIPAISTILQDSTGFRIVMSKERSIYGDGYNIRYSQLLDSAGLEVYLFNIAIQALTRQEDSTRFYELSDAYTQFTNDDIIEVRRIRVLNALEGSWTVTRVSDDQTWQGTFLDDQFTIGAQSGTVTVETSRSIKIVGLSIGDLYLDAINQDLLKSRNETFLFTRN